MKALILLIALACISSTFAVSLRMRNHKAHRASQENEDDKVAALEATIDILDGLINDPEASKEFLAHFLENDTDEVTKDEFFEGLNEWSKTSGLGELDRDEIDAIFDKIDKDGNGVLSADEVSEGGAEIFGWYRAMIQKQLDKLNGNKAHQIEDQAPQENDDDKVAALKATIDILDGLINDPEASKEFLAHFLENDTDEVTKDEFFEGLNEWSKTSGLGEQDRAEIDAIFDKIDKDGDGVLSADEVSEGGAEIFGWFRDVITQNLDDQNVAAARMPTENLTVPYLIKSS